MTTDVPDLPENDLEGPATPAAVMLMTVMALYECRGLELLGHHVLKAMTEGQTPSEVLKNLLEKLPHDDTS
jgi:hypothetical protein